MGRSIRRAAVVLLALPLLLTSCSYVADTEALLRPPTLNPQQAAVYAALETTLNISDIVYKPPLRGEHRSPFVFYDLDGDQREEAVVFYSYKSDPSNTRAKILRQDGGGGWQPVKDLSSSCDQVDFVQFAGMLPGTGDCMVIGWQNTAASSAGNAGRFLSVYSMADGAVTPEVLRQNYIEFLVRDFDRDGLEELVTVGEEAGGSAGQSRTLTISRLRAVEGRLAATETLPLCDKADMLLRPLISGVLWDGGFAVYIDELRVDGSYATEIVRVGAVGMEMLAGGNGVSTPEQKDPVFESYSFTFRDNPVLSWDYNQDGVVEVPGAPVKLPGNLNQGEEHPLTLTELMNLTPEGMSVVERAVINNKEGYLVFMPEEWLLWEVSVLREEEDRVWKFYLLEPDTEDIRFELLQIQALSQALPETDDSDMIPLGSRGGRHFYGYIPLATPDMPSITEPQLHSMFRVLP